MRKFTFYTWIWIFLCMSSLWACAPQAQDVPTISDPAPHIVIDQFGYLPSLQKRAIIRNPKIGADAGHAYAPGRVFRLVDVKTGAVMHEGAAMPWNDGRTDPASGDQVWVYDFSAVQSSGRYKVVDVERGVESDPFTIARDVYKPVLKAAFKTFYYQRVGFEKRSPYVAAGYTDGASHLGVGQDTEARLFTAKDDSSTARDLRGGWYDAGDYNKYTNWTANYIIGLLHAYLETPSVWTDDFGIPESGNGVPDILDEVHWGLGWLERMQNPDGSMLSVMGLDSASPPSAARGSSYYGPPNASATLTSAGAFALAAQVYKGQDSNRYAKRAQSAWRWAEQNPNVTFQNNDSAYGSEGLAAGQQDVDAKGRQSKRLLAASYLYTLTGQRSYLDVLQSLYAELNPINPYYMNGYEADLTLTLLHVSKAAGFPPVLKRKIMSDFQGHILQADNGLATVRDRKDAFAAYVPEYTWGSNALKSRFGTLYAQAAIEGISGRNPSELYNAASGYLHYLHGVNPTGRVYLSNMGRYGATRSVTTMFHAWFADGNAQYDNTETSVYGPAPGFVVGGPNEFYEADGCCPRGCGGQGNAQCRNLLPAFLMGQPPAKSYAETNAGWPINSWQITENSNNYQVAYLRLLAKFAQ